MTVNDLSGHGARFDDGLLLGYFHRDGTLYKALIRDLNQLIELGTINAKQAEDRVYILQIQLDWPTKMTETAFFEQIKKLPTAKADGVLCPVKIEGKKGGLI